MEELSTNEVKKVLKDLVMKSISKEVYVPIMLWGQPGVGKSAIPKQIAKELGIEFKDDRLSMFNPVDLRGLPYPNPQTGEAEWLRPEFLPVKGKGIWLLDELTQAPVSVQNAAYRIILDRSVSDKHKIGDGWFIIAAANEGKDLSGTNQMPMPLRNRFCHIRVISDFDDWKSGFALKNGIRHEIISFLNFSPSSLNTFKRDNDLIVYATPRTWEKASDVINLMGLNEAAYCLISGLVGIGTCHEFKTFIQVYNKLPDIGEILDGKVIDHDKERSLLFALLGKMLYELKKRKYDSKSLCNYIRYWDALRDEENRPMKEYEILAIKDLLKLNPELLNQLVTDKFTLKIINENRSFLS